MPTLGPRSNTRRYFLAAALTCAPLAACNAIWGIDLPTLIDGGEAGHPEASNGDGAPKDSTTHETSHPDGRADVGVETSGDGGIDATHDATDGGADGRQDATIDHGTDALADSGLDATADAVPDMSLDAALDATVPFDGACTASGVVTKLADGLGDPNSVATDEGGVYWTYGATGSLGVQRFGVPGPVFGFVGDGGLSPGNVVAAGGYVVWAADETGEIFVCSAAACSGDVHVLANKQFGVFQSTANGTTAFWNRGSSPPPSELESCALSGCAGVPTPVGDASTGGGSPTGFALDPGFIYWSVASAIYSCPLAGCGAPTRVLTDTNSPASLAISGGRLYWADSLQIGSCALDGGGCDIGDAGVSVFSATPGRNLVADDQNLYFAGSSNDLYKVPLDGGAPDGTAAYQAVNRIGGVAVGPSCVFWTRDDAGVFATLK